jgi:hypothetical protein
MNFEETISPVTKYLLDNNFKISESWAHYIRYSSGSVIIIVGYSDRERLFSYFAGYDHELPVEIGPRIINTVFGDDRFGLQQSLTIPDFISFIKNKGSAIVKGDRQKLKEMKDLMARESEESAVEAILHQNLREAEKAWDQKDYRHFIKCVNRVNKDDLPLSYVRKRLIALKELGER